MSKTPFAVVALVALSVFAGPAAAGPEVNTAPGDVIFDGEPAPGLAAHGYDVVAYFTDSKPTKGDQRFTVIHQEATYRFANKANLDAFNASPAKYKPAYGGYCAYGVSLGAKFDGKPDYWKIVDGKLYLNLSRDAQRAWNKDIPGHIVKADTNWPKIVDKKPSELQ